jgi:hypothetical protein
MSIHTAGDTCRADGRGGRGPARGLLPEPAPRVGAHAYAGKRVRDDVREAVLVMAFSVASSVGLALSLTVVVHLVG